MKEINLKGVRGNTKTLNLVFKEDDAVIDITNYIVFFTLKEKITDTDDQAVFKKNVGPGQDDEHNNPTQGQTMIILERADTENLEGKYHYDIKYKKTDGTVITFMIGEFVFQPRVTIRIS